MELKGYKGVWVIGEQKDGVIHGVTHELITWGRALADDLGTYLACVMLGEEIEDLEDLTKRGVDKVFFIKDPSLKKFLPRPYANAITELAKEEKPDIIVAAATTTGRTIMPLVAYKLQTGLTADCTELTIDTEAQILLQTRPAIGGNIMATIKTPNHKPQMATVRPKAAKPAPVNPAYTGEVIVKSYEANLFATPEKFLEFIKDTTQDVNIEDADIIVAGGKGCKNAEGFRLVEELAAVLGAGVGATRDAVDLGWTTYSHQIGLSGKTVAPSLYFAIGISGTIQHLAGMQTSGIIVAINKDPQAQIFKVADFGIVGDMKEVVPQLIEAFKKMKASA